MAREAISDYYAQRQLALIKKWNTTAIAYNSSMQVTLNSSQINDAYLGHGFNDADYWVYPTSDPIKPVSVTLVNGSTVYVKGLKSTYNYPTTPLRSDKVDYLFINGSSIDQPDLNVTHYQQWHDLWNATEQQEDQVESELSTFINNTYGNYQAGEINTSDLVDPYLSAREYSPEGNWKPWTLRTLISLGLSPPKNVSNFGSMTIEDPDGSYSGILLSDGVPSGGAFKVGETYDPANLTGSQLLMDPDNKRGWSLDKPFTINKATNANGKSMSTIEYRTIDYNTSTVKDYDNLMANLTDMRAQINALQQRLRSDATGGGLLGGKDPALVGLIALILVALGAMIRREGA